MKKAFSGKQEIKNKYIRRDRIAFLSDSDLGIPIYILVIEDLLYKALPSELSVTWMKRFFEAIPVGSDLSDVWRKYALWHLIDDKYGVINFAQNEEIKEYIRNVSNLYLNNLDEVKTDNLYQSTNTSPMPIFESDSYGLDNANFYSKEAAFFFACLYKCKHKTDDIYYTMVLCIHEGMLTSTFAYEGYNLINNPDRSKVLSLRQDYKIIQSEKFLQLLKESK